MKNDELDEFAAKFLNLWQENFHKAIADRKIIEYMMQAASNMQQFYDNKSFAPTIPNPFDAWSGKHGGSDDSSRIDELERRIAALEKGSGKNKSSSKK